MIIIAPEMVKSCITNQQNLELELICQLTIMKRP